MLPIQDVVPSGRVPRATIALIFINTMVFAGQLLLRSPFPTIILLSPFAHLSTAHFGASVLFLWLFGDNVEARIGRRLFVTLYGVSAAAGTYIAWTVTGEVVAIGAACAVTGILGAYFVLLPKSRVLVLVPLPLDLAEAPALFFLGLWWLFHAVSFVAGPSAAPSLLWPLVAAFSIGGALGLLTRRRMVW